MSIDNSETAVSVIRSAIGARCIDSACRNLGRLILRHADAGGRPFSNLVLCHAPMAKRGWRVTALLVSRFLAIANALRMVGAFCLAP